MNLSARDRFARTVCDCAGCKVGCKTMPGTTTCVDVGRIAAHLGQNNDRKFLTENFRLSTSAKAARFTENGMEVFVIPTITPAQQPDGRCVFLTADDQCSVHPVAPMGCSHCDVHQTRAQGDAPVKAMMQEILIDRELRGEYFQHCVQLIDAGKVSSNVEGRRFEFERQLQAARDAGLVADHPELINPSDLDLLEALEA